MHLYPSSVFKFDRVLQNVELTSSTQYHYSSLPGNDSGGNSFAGIRNFGWEVVNEPTIIPSQSK